MFKKFVKKTFKSMKKILKNPGRAIKKGLGKIGKAFGKLGPIGTIALSLMMPGLGAAWSTFSTYAAGTSGAMGAVLQGIATAGNAIGSVYSSVTGMVSKTLNTVTGGASGKLSNWVGTKLDDARLAVGLPTSNLTADSAMADAAKLGEDVTSKGIEINPQGADTNFVTKDVDRFATNKGSLLNPTETKGVQSIEYATGEAIPKPTPLSSKDLNISFNPQKPTLSSVTSQGNTTDIITGFEKNTTFVGANDIEVTSLKPTYTTVSTSDLTKDQLYQNNRLSKFQTNLSNNNAKILKGIENNPNFSNFDLLRQETAQLAKVASGGVALESMGKEEEMTGGGTPYVITALPTDVNTSNDYSKAYADQFAQAGYTGPQNMQGFAQAGFYGGDPYSFSQVLRNNKVAIPTATVRI
jgi:hypothetical protein|tara:strand:+ start:665 stop:1894 length:1230 start_codon:yes stop_codon:yes gene_type:complete